MQVEPTVDAVFVDSDMKENVLMLFPKCILALIC